MNVNLSSLCTFDVGPFAHESSWGRRQKTLATTNCNNNEPAVTSLWSSNHFKLEEVVGKGHFGCVYRATHHEYQPFRPGGGGGGSSSAGVGDRPCLVGAARVNKHIVAVKSFCKKEILYQLAHGGRSLELLQREVNIHSW